MRRSARVGFLVLPGFLFPVFLHAQASIEGQVKNGTTNRPVPNQLIRLLLPRGGMQQVATTATDSEGRFNFGQGEEVDPGAFYLLETEFQGVKYPSPAQFDSTGSARVNITVYDSTHSDAVIRVQSLRLLVRAEGTRVRVQEEYSILNLSSPPRTFMAPEGTFHFYLSARATELVVSVTGMMDMPLPQSPEAGKTPGEYSIGYALKPGVTTATVAYTADYASHDLALSHPVAYPVDRTELYVAPSSLSVSSTTLKPAGADPANNVQKLEGVNLARGATLDVRVSGEATTRAQGQTEGGQPGAGASEAEVKVVPNSMTQLAGPLLLCLLLVLIWALGVRAAKEWPQSPDGKGQSPVRKQLEAKVDGLFNSLADLDELFAAGKIAENKYWKERLELKARLTAAFRKAPPSLLESYATRHTGT